jgi:uncharacterized protein YjbI with pentapeptide repeats
MIDIGGEPRSLAEMRFAYSLVPCTGCGSREIGAIEYRGMGKVQVYSGTCPRCRTTREVTFHPRGKVATSAPMHELGGPEPSRIIKPVQFVEELDRVGTRVVWEPEELAPGPWTASYQAIDRALICLAELLKFVPSDSDAIPDGALDAAGKADRNARSEKYQREWLTAERDRYRALWDRYLADAPRKNAIEDAERGPAPVARGEMNRHTVEAHMAWLRRQRVGDGRLDVANLDLTGVRVGAQDLSWARLDGVILDRADVAYSKLAHAELTDVKLVQANLGSASFDGARLVRCDLLGANLALGKLEDAVIGGGRFDRAYLDRALFRRARIDGASFREADFGNAALDQAVFTDCDLRDASFSLRTRDLLGTTTRTRFERCDLRNTKWAGRELEGAVFVDCKLYGISGSPSRLRDLVFERPDLSPAGDGRIIGNQDDVLALWRGDVVDLI